MPGARVRELQKWKITLFTVCFVALFSNLLAGTCFTLCSLITAAAATSHSCSSVHCCNFPMPSSSCYDSATDSTRRGKSN